MVERDKHCLPKFQNLQVRGKFFGGEKVSRLQSGSYLKCMLACRYLTTSVKTRYSQFIQLREEHLKTLYDYKQNDGVECTLWPNLYLFYEWCETKLFGNTSRQSAKFSFVMKILSEILDYSLDYDLLLAYLVYDLQQSHKIVLPRNENPTCLTTDEEDKSNICLHYPETAFALKLRAYISCVLPFLKCSMDV